jgi:hypothetical protein
MLKHIIAASVASLGIVAAPVLAAEQKPSTQSGPTTLSDHELDQVVAGDPLILVSVMAPVYLHIEPITVQIPVNVAAVVQANVLGNGVFDAVAVGTQNNIYGATAAFRPGG